MDKLLTMSDKEITLMKVIQKLEEKRLRQKEAGEMLGISTRHVRRLLHAFRQEGESGLISKRRGKPSNNRLKTEIKQQAIELLCSRYHDFGPTLAQEKLSEIHDLNISRESVRGLMVSEGVWKPKKLKLPPIHQMRERRACYGELVQIDGSPHAWFEDRGPKCSLLVFIDDATGRLMELFFAPAETTFSYFAATRRYLHCHGRPVAFYSDKHGIFRINSKHALSGSGMTQFGRAMKSLDIDIICANTPQAKGRVERVIETLQDRLVKEMRLENISTIEDANAFAPSYMLDFNHRFAVPPRNKHDNHRPLLSSDDQLDIIFSHQETRILSKNLTIQYNKVIYQIQTNRPSYVLRQAQVTVCEDPKGDVSILFKDKPLNYSISHKQLHQSQVVFSKDIDYHLKNTDHPHKPAQDHPWRRYGHRISGKPIQEHPPKAND